MEASTKAVVIAAGLGVAAYFAYRSFGRVGQAVGKVGEAAGHVGQAVNPLNPDNVFSSTTNKIGAAISGDEGWSLGGWLFDLTHPTPAEPLPSLTTRPIDFGIGTTWEAPLGQL